MQGNEKMKQGVIMGTVAGILRLLLSKLAAKGQGHQAWGSNKGTLGGNLCRFLEAESSLEDTATSASSPLGKVDFISPGFSPLPVAWHEGGTVINVVGLCSGKEALGRK